MASPNDVEARLSAALKQAYPLGNSTQLGNNITGSASRGRRPRSSALILSIGAVAIAMTLVVITVARTSGENDTSPPAGAPAWAVSCLSTGGPITHEFDGLAVAQATQKAAALGQRLTLGAQDGACITRSYEFIPKQVVIAVSKGVIVMARFASS
jgi:hypothetical protein